MRTTARDSWRSASCARGDSVRARVSMTTTVPTHCPAGVTRAVAATMRRPRAVMHGFPENCGCVNASSTTSTVPGGSSTTWAGGRVGRPGADA